FSRVTHVREAAGFLFEALAQKFFGQGCYLALIPMLLVTDKKPDSLPRWHSSHITRPNPTLEVLIHVQPSCTVEYLRMGPSLITPNVLYVPGLDNEEALNSFILLDDCLYIFRFTIAAYC